MKQFIRPKDKLYGIFNLSQYSSNFTSATKIGNRKKSEKKEEEENQSITVRAHSE